MHGKRVGIFEHEHKLVAGIKDTVTLVRLIALRTNVIAAGINFINLKGNAFALVRQYSY
jgi:hypothetical protein